MGGMIALPHPPVARSSFAGRPPSWEAAERAISGDAIGNPVRVLRGKEPDRVHRRIGPSSGGFVQRFPARVDGHPRPIERMPLWAS
jgi:hypothetical protein